MHELRKKSTFSKILSKNSQNCVLISPKFNSFEAQNCVLISEFHRAYEKARNERIGFCDRNDKTYIPLKLRIVY